MYNQNKKSKSRTNKPGQNKEQEFYQRGNRIVVYCTIKIDSYARLEKIQRVRVLWERDNLISILYMEFPFQYYCLGLWQKPALEPLEVLSEDFEIVDTKKRTSSYLFSSWNWSAITAEVQWGVCATIDDRYCLQLSILSFYCFPLSIL